MIVATTTKDFFHIFSLSQKQCSKSANLISVAIKLPQIFLLKGRLWLS